MKFRIAIHYFLLLTLTAGVETNATIRYVSKTGSSTPPYTSWLTASDSIQKCVDFSTAGDTIYVANGVYKEQIVMIPGLALIGGGMDSCVVDTRSLPQPSGFSSINAKDSCVLEGFKIIVSESHWGFGIRCQQENQIINTIVKNNSVESCFNAIYIEKGYSLIEKNLIYDVDNGITTEISDALITNNFLINVNNKGIDADLNSFPTIRNNIVIINNNQAGASGYSSFYNHYSELENNLFINGNTGVAAWGKEYIYNNVISGNYEYGIITQNGDSIKNNIITKGQTGLWFSGTADTSIIRYNNLWNNRINYRSHNPDSTNLYKDPMFVNDTSDYHLQKFSPMIDAGDPAILDEDLTRSDIGLYGGPYGEVYVHNDLAPKQPRNLSAILDTQQIILKWNKNTEADTNHYNIYRDTTQNFAINATKLIASQAETLFIQPTSTNVNRYVYKITSVDNQGNESIPSEEIEINLTFINDYPIKVSDYYLYQNYPNPFNSSTIVGYKLKEKGYVKLVVYDLKGEVVKVLVNESKAAGYYEIRFDATGLSSGMYLCKMDVRKDNNIPKFTEINKMILIK